MKAIWGLVACLAAIEGVHTHASRTQWDGIFTDAQAKRGEVVYHRHCASCHGANLAGAEFGPELRGKAFGARWNGESMAALFGRIKATMPEQAPGTLSDRQYVDVLAFIVSMGGPPAGDTELSTQADALSRITFTAVKP